MDNIHSNLSLQNDLANDSKIAGAIEVVNHGFTQLLEKGSLSPKPLLVCSGGTSTRCAYDGHWTLDLRKNYKGISFNKQTLEVDVEAGNNMKNILEYLDIYNRSFPSGLSTLPGFGYLLTGGISPLSRKYGLAIDQIIRIKGVFGNGNRFEAKLPSPISSDEDKLLWKGLCGAAPLIAIVTDLRLKTIPAKKLFIIESFINPEDLILLIEMAEEWSNSRSLQWIWGEKIKVYIVIEKDDLSITDNLNQLEQEYSFLGRIKISERSSMSYLPKFSPNSNRLPKKCYSEVVGLLAPSWGKDTKQIIKCISNLISERPHPNCSIAAQQLGGVVSEINDVDTSFIHRDSMWKPWITSFWEADDNKLKLSSLSWLQEAWNILEAKCPNNHLAQMHQHMPWHDREINSAFKEWLPGLRKLKSLYDPSNNLPSL